MKCNFNKIDNNLHQCSECGFIIKTTQESEKIYRNCRPPNQPPKILEQIKQVTKEIKNTIHLASAEKVSERLQICQSCEHYNNNTCSLCGCYMNLKTRLETSSCPIGKW